MSSASRCSSGPWMLGQRRAEAVDARLSTPRTSLRVWEAQGMGSGGLSTHSPHTCFPGLPQVEPRPGCLVAVTLPPRASFICMVTSLARKWASYLRYSQKWHLCVLTTVRVNYLAKFSAVGSFHFWDGDMTLLWSPLLSRLFILKVFRMGVCFLSS